MCTQIDTHLHVQPSHAHTHTHTHTRTSSQQLAETTALRSVSAFITSPSSAVSKSSASFSGVDLAWKERECVCVHVCVCVGDAGIITHICI